MQITLEAVSNGFILMIATRQGMTKTFFPNEDYEKMSKEISDVISEYEAQRREFVANQNKGGN